MTQDRWLLFMQQQLAPHGHLLSQIQGFNEFDLELHHDFIQWLFPCAEPSKVNPDAPLLTRIHCEVIQISKGMKKEVGRNLDLMLGHWGIKRVGSTFQRADNFDSGSRYWCCPIDHNHLRITRVLTFLVLTGFGGVANALYDYLYQELLQSVLSNIGAMPYWTQALTLEPLLAGKNYS